MTKSQRFMSILLILLSATALFGQSISPQAAVAEFYKYGDSHSKTFNRRWIDSRKKWLSPRLYNLFLKELRAERAFLKNNPSDKPYFGDGVPFGPLDEPCDVDGRSLKRKYVVQTGVIKGRNAAEVPVRFYYPKPCTIKDIVYKTKLVKTGRGWAIDDVIFGGGSSLTVDMQRQHY